MEVKTFWVGKGNLVKPLEEAAKQNTRGQEYMSQIEVSYDDTLDITVARVAGLFWSQKLDVFTQLGFRMSHFQGLNFA